MRGVMWLETVKSELIPISLAPLVVPIVGFFLSETFHPISIVIQVLIPYIGMGVIGVPIISYLIKRDKLSSIFIGLYGMLGGAVFGLIVGLIILAVSIGDIATIQVSGLGFVSLLSILYGGGVGLVIGVTFGLIRQLTNYEQAT